MSVLVVGLSHRSAPLEVLERVSLDRAGALSLGALATEHEDVAESVVVSTCNRTEVYAAAHTFHGALAQLGESLGRVTGVPVRELTEHLYVYYDDRAVSHLFSLSCGLESMALGEAEILGQLRAALLRAQQHGHAGKELNPLFQQALRVGKQARTQTGIEAAGRSLVGVGLEQAAGYLGDLGAARALVVGAGAMSGLATATLLRAGVQELTVLNRTRERAERLARSYGVASAPWAALPAELGRADLVVSCTGATGRVIDRPMVQQARAGRPAGTPLALVDLAMPRDVDPALAHLPGVRVWSLADLQGEQPEVSRHQVGDAVAQVRELVTAGVTAYLLDRRAQQLGPTLTALRERAMGVVDAEVTRLEQRLVLDDLQRAEVRQTLRRVVDKLLHTPTVRVKELAAGDGPGDYAQVLRQLFDLDPRDAAAVTHPPPGQGIA